MKLYFLHRKQKNFVLELNQRTLVLYFQCPKLNKERVYRAVELIPDSVNPKENKNWSYDIKMIEDNETYKKVATGVKPTIQQAYYLIAEENKPRWDEDEEAYEKDYANVQNPISTVEEEAEHPVVSESKKMLWIGISAFIILWIIFHR